MNIIGDKLRTVSGIFILILILGGILLPQPLQAQPDQNDLVRVYGEQQDDYSIRFYADNNLIIPAYVVVTFENLVNLSPDTEMPFSVQLESGAEKQYLFSLNPGDGDRLSYRFSYTFSRGNPQSVSPDGSFLYTFPYTHGSKHRITQGFNGRFTHMDDNRYAVDFDLEVGTPVVAARSGLVVEVKEDSNIGGRSVNYGRHGNYILIMHEDGTFGNYVHLKQNGALVEVGQEVEQGEQIGLSGNTGRSSGPHLHFDVRIPLENGRMQSIPIRFRGRDGEPIQPEEGEIYYAYQPEGGDFTEIFGADYTNSDFAEYSGTARVQDNLDFRVEQTDLTYVIFIGNGFDYPVNAEVELRLENMNSTRQSPVNIRLGAGEERFLTIVRPRDGVSSWRYGYAVNYRRIE
ncbi:M23 family metallopeptidase [Salinispira pacifica]|uniref:Putative secreted peptidase n=1 Tax=Salinispira pacifica TaxID=1307761 RepID=V5WNI2_9SPIO|nr:M23 family metallopeptidase [Salinispira pacifica]AHC16814.1 putative secreted peptidase [Salinispira pacifica]